MRLLALLCAAGAISAGSALAQTPDDRAVCAKRQGDESIEACTREIASGTLSGRDLANTHYNRAVAHRTKRAQDLALPDLDAAIQIEPSVAAYFLVRARVWLTKNDLDRAIGDLDEAIKLRPKYATALYERGRIWRRKGEADRAVADFTAGARTGSKSEYAFLSLVQLAETLLEKGDEPGAFAAFDEAVRDYPDNAGGYYGRALARKKKGDLDGAVADLNEAIRIDPKHTSALFDRALIRHNAGNWDSALADYDEVLKLAPRYAVGFNNRGNVWREKGDLDRAIADHDEAIRLNPNFSRAYRNRGLVWKRKRDLDRALADYNKSIELDATQAYLFVERGKVFEDKGDFDRALADLDEAVRLDPNSGGPHNDRGVARYRKGDIDRAIADYSEAIRLNPTNILPRRNRALAWEKKNENERAIVDYSDVLLIDSKHVRTYNSRALLYERMGNLEKALADFRAAVALDPKLPNAADRIKRLEEKIAAAAVPAKPPEQKPAVAQQRAAPAVPETRIALVIGNSGYLNATKLPNPKRDAEKIAASLKRVGFTNVTLKLDLPRDQLNAALKAFAAETARADWAVVYYAGHGIEFGGNNYLVPVDATLRSDRDISFEAVALEQVLFAVEGAKKLRLVILDACRDNPFAKKMERANKTRSVGAGLAQIEPEGATLVAYAAKHGQTAEDGEGGNSPFAAALSKHLETPGTEINLLFRRVRDDVLKVTQRHQEPFTYGSLPAEEFYFRPK